MCSRVMIFLMCESLMLGQLFHVTNKEAPSLKQTSQEIEIEFHG